MGGREDGKDREELTVLLSQMVPSGPMGVGEALPRPTVELPRSPSHPIPGVTLAHTPLSCLGCTYSFPVLLVSGGVLGPLRDPLGPGPHPGSRAHCLGPRPARGWWAGGPAWAQVG